MLLKPTVCLATFLVAFASLASAQETPTNQIDQLKAQVKEQQRQIDELKSILDKEKPLLEQLSADRAKQANEEQEHKVAKSKPAVEPVPAGATAPASPATTAQTSSPLAGTEAASTGTAGAEVQPGQVPEHSYSTPSTNAAHPLGISRYLIASLSQNPPIIQIDTTPSPGGRAVPPTQLSDSIEFKQGKFRIGALLYADWADYYGTGFGPQFLTQINPAGPGNDGYNTFEINRTYLNFYFSPNDNITFRVTPNIYRQFAGVSAVKYGSVTGISASANENLTLRLKYAYVDIKNFLGGNAKGVTWTLGQLQNPLVDWEENLWSYRFVSLVPWNYLSLSSTQTGIALHGPLQVDGKTYFDFNAGVYTQASFHAYEQAESKQVMARATVYPFGSATAYENLGITGFFDYARSNAYPETPRTIPIYRGVAMVHYGTKNNMSNIAFEYDFGRNAFSAGNLFSGDGPIDQFGLGTSPYAGMDNVIKAILGVDSAKQRGYNLFGHLQLGKSPFQIFGWFENFQPNTEVHKDPADFNRVIGGVSYRANKSLRFAFDFQDLLYYHSQFTFPADELARFSASLAKSNPDGVPNVVPPDIKAFFINMEFSY